MQRVVRQENGVIVRRSVVRERKQMISYMEAENGTITCPYCKESHKRLYRVGNENSFPWACRYCVRWLFAKLT